MIEDLVRVWPVVLGLVAVIALVVRIDALARENAKKITTLFDLLNRMIERELNKRKD